MTNKLALFITHNIFLTNLQINELFDNSFIKTSGVSVPVWINSKNSKTTEPALEFFCEYKIHDTKEQFSDIKFNKKGYEIFLPNPKWKDHKKIKIEDLASLSEKERSDYEKKTSKWWKENPKPMSIENLINSKYFRTKIKKLDQKIDKLSDCLIDIQHTIEIKSIDCLKNSLTS